MRPQRGRRAGNAKPSPTSPRSMPHSKQETPMPEDNKELETALRAQETRLRVESFVMKIGASKQAAKLISGSPAELARFTWDGVNLRFGKGDLTAVDDPAAREFYAAAPFKGLFPPPATKDDVQDQPQMNERLVA